MAWTRVYTGENYYSYKYMGVYSKNIYISKGTTTSYTTYKWDGSSFASNSLTGNKLTRTKTRPSDATSDPHGGTYDTCYYANISSGTYAGIWAWVTYSNDSGTIETAYLYKWSSNSTLTANANGGSIPSTSGWTGTGSTATKSVAPNAPYEDCAYWPVPTRSGYLFEGWYSASSGGSQFTGSDGEVSDYSDMATDYYDLGDGHWLGNGTNLTLYAHWKTAGATVYVKTGENTWSTGTVYIKTGESTWTQASRVYIKTGESTWT